MFQHVLGIIDLKKLKNDKKYTHSIISFHFLLYSWRNEDLMTIMIDLNFKRFMKWGRSFVLWSDILEFLYKRHTGCNMMLRFSHFSLFLWLLENDLKNAATDFVIMWHIEYTEQKDKYEHIGDGIDINNDLKKKKNYNIILKFKREGFPCTESELVTSSCLV